MTILFLGNGGASREIRGWFQPWGGEKIGVLDDAGERRITGHVPAMGERLVASIGNPSLRRALCEPLDSLGADWQFVEHETSIIAAEIPTNSGTIACPAVYLCAGAKIGRFGFFNFGALVGDECVVGDYVTLAPYAALLHGAKVGSGSMIGTRATVMMGATVALCGWGAFVIVAALEVWNR